MLASPRAISTFISYTLMGARASPTWAIPNYEQIVCSCDYVTRSIAVDGMSRCDCLPATHMILQRGPAGTLLVLDGGPEFCSYMMHSDDCSDATVGDVGGVGGGIMASSPGSLCVVPFSSCAVIGLNEYVCNRSSGVLTVTWLKRAAYITITVYGSIGRASTPNSAVPFCRGEGPPKASNGVVWQTTSDREERAKAVAQQQNGEQKEAQNSFAPSVTNRRTIEEASARDKSPDPSPRWDRAGDSLPRGSGEDAIDLLAEVMREAELDTMVDGYQPVAVCAASDQNLFGGSAEPVLERGNGSDQEEELSGFIGFDSQYPSPTDLEGTDANCRVSPGQRELEEDGSGETTDPSLKFLVDPEVAESRGSPSFPSTDPVN